MTTTRTVFFNDNLDNKDNFLPTTATAVYGVQEKTTDLLKRQLGQLGTTLILAYDATASTDTLIGKKRVVRSCPSCL